uniref:Uncharacterized protein n=1 Tax=Oryza brachyantha TaxID=4533 RepID=J3L7Y4_ORYBR
MISNCGCVLMNVQWDQRRVTLMAGGGVVAAGVVALEVEVCDVVVWDVRRRGFLEAEAAAAVVAVAGEDEAEPEPASCWRSRRRAAGTQVLLTWVEQSKPRLLQHVRQR